MFLPDAESGLGLDLERATRSLCCELVLSREQLQPHKSAAAARCSDDDDNGGLGLGGRSTVCGELSAVAQLNADTDSHLLKLLHSMF